MADRQRARLAALVSHTRTHSPYYRRLYQECGVPSGVDDLTALPVTDKRRGGFRRLGH